jgi:hypothetical protein
MRPGHRKLGRIASSATSLRAAAAAVIKTRVVAAVVTSVGIDRQSLNPTLTSRVTLTLLSIALSRQVSVLAAGSIIELALLLRSAQLRWFRLVV